MVSKSHSRRRPLAMAAVAAACLVFAAPAAADTVLFRVNTGGPAVAGTPAWSADTRESPSAYGNAEANGNKTTSTTSTVSVLDSSVPVGTPAALFADDRYDPRTGAPDLSYAFPAPAGTGYQVKLFFAEINTAYSVPGTHTTDVSVDGTQVLNDFDIVAAAGGMNKAIVKTFNTASDGTINVDLKRVAGNPSVSAIEIDALTGTTPPPPPAVLTASPTSLAFPSVTPGTTWALPVTLTNSAPTGGASLTVDSTAISGSQAAEFSDSFTDASDVTLAPGASTTVYVTFAPASAGAKSATLAVTQTGTALTTNVALTGTGQAVTQPGTGTWTTGAPMPRDVGEVSAGVIGTKIWVVGGDDTRTFSYTPSTNVWVQKNLAVRPYVGDHHAAESINGELYLFGGDTAGMGKIQIYNPTSNSWRLGADIPISTGSAATALINGKVYYAGGEGSVLPKLGAIYDVASNTWSSTSAMAPMTRGVTHGAAGTDGSKLYVFGGRGDATTGGSSASNLVQIYDPITNTWTSSAQAGSGIPPFPVAHGGMGKAIYSDGRFYVMGGEDLANVGGTTTGGVYNRVDIYTVATKTWSVGTAMPTPRHGIFPVLYGGKIYVAGGGIHNYHSSSTTLEIYTPN